MAKRYCFGPIEIRPGARQVLVDGRAVAIGARALDVLLALVERRDRIVTKEELFELAWPGLIVEDNNLQVQISTIRKHLGSAAIATVANRGYQFTLEPDGDAVPMPPESLRNDLPCPITSFVGRRREIAQVADMLARHRLVTFVGMGGVGKTRLALQVGAGQVDNHADGARFVELAGIGHGERVPDAIAAALGVPPDPHRAPMEALLRHVRGREMLVILDNCEHLLASCASLVTHLLQKAPRLRILATSRESLRILGEATFPVPRLGLAADGSSEAVQLFVERAKAASPAFEITPANGTTVSELCRRLDGIPLALELAAARLRALSVEAIAERLGERFGLLKVPIATATPRHQALRACLDWSHDLLPEQERVVLRRLAVFAGGCRLDAAEAVVAGGTVAADDVAELLANLVDKSMVEHDPATDRYGLLETVRQYALERLAESGDEQATRGRHLHYHVQLVETAWPHLDGSNPRPWFARLDIERENLLAAHGFCDEAPDGAEQGLRLTIACARRYWIQRAHVDLAMQMILRALGHRQVDRHPALRASATAVAGLYASFKADYAAARRHLEDCLSMEATAADPNIEAYARRVLGGVCHSCGERQAARRHFEACLALRARVRDQFIVYLCLNNLSYLHIEQGEFEAAERLLAESFAFFTEAAHPNHHALTLFGATTLCLHRGDAVNARRCLGAATRIIEWLDLLSLRPVALEIAAALAALEGDAERAARYIGASGAEVAQTHIFLYAPGSALRAPFIDAARKRLGAEAFAAAEAIGRELSYQEALSEASRWLSPERVPEEASS